MATIIDANKCVLGRMANQVAKRLLQGEEIHIINAEKAIVSGTSKATIKNRYLQRYHLGTYRKGPFMHRMPHDLVKRSVRGMIPYQTPRGRDALKRLKAHIGIPAEFQGMDAEVIQDAQRTPRGMIMTIGEISHALGAPFKPEVQ